MVYSHTMEYYSAIQTNENWYLLWHGQVLKTLSKVKEVRHKRLRIIWICIYEMPRTGKFRETERSVVCQRLPGVGGWGWWGMTVNVSNVCGGDKNVLELVVMLA